MGWAQRVKHQQRAAGATTTTGNPVAPLRRMTFIRADRHAEAIQAGATMTRVRFSDREYAMDARGSLRRLAPLPTYVNTKP